MRSARSQLDSSVASGLNAISNRRFSNDDDDDDGVEDDKLVDNAEVDDDVFGDDEGERDNTLKARASTS